MNKVLFLSLSVGMLYAWAGTAFLCFRFFRPETEFRMWQFLNAHHAIFASRFVGFWGRQVVSRHDATPRMIRRAGMRGWTFILL
ncbi:MAG TPA: hypothetical protein VL527_07140, partial [Dongiaceae bacterium]|nr:hypothetical protein [Dongiaceae bacterium]